MDYYNRRLHPKFNLNKDNFHFVIKNKNIFSILQNKLDLEYWRESKLYADICLKLYKQGVEILNNWNYYIEKADNGCCNPLFSQGNFEATRLRQYKVYYYVFGKGFEHFLEITKQYGHNINGTQYIHSTYKEGIYYEVNEPFGIFSYFEHKIEESKKWW